MKIVVFHRICVVLRGAGLRSVPEKGKASHPMYPAGLHVAVKPLLRVLLRPPWARRGGWCCLCFHQNGIPLYFQGGLSDQVETASHKHALHYPLAHDRNPWIFRGLSFYTTSVDSIPTLFRIGLNFAVFGSILRGFCELNETIPEYRKPGNPVINSISGLPSPRGTEIW